VKNRRQQIKKLAKENACRNPLADIVVSSGHDPDQSDDHKFEMLEIYDYSTYVSYVIVR